MAFAGISKDEDRGNLIAYLRSQSDSPIAIPPAPPEEPAAEEEGDIAAPEEDAPAEPEPEAAKSADDKKDETETPADAAPVDQPAEAEHE